MDLEGDANDRPCIIHEVRNESLGLEKYGSIFLAEPGLRNRITKGNTVSEGLRRKFNRSTRKYLICNRVSKVETR
jgi:hypothetical protein